MSHCELNYYTLITTQYFRPHPNIMFKKPWLKSIHCTKFLEIQYRSLKSFYVITLEPRHKRPRHMSRKELFLGKSKRSCLFAGTAWERIVCIRGPFSQFICFSPFHVMITWRPWFKGLVKRLSDSHPKSQNPEEALVWHKLCQGSSVNLTLYLTYRLHLRLKSLGISNKLN